MATRHNNGRTTPGKTSIPFELNILDLVEAAVRVRARHDLGGIEVTIRDHECVAETVLLAPEQGLARLLIETTLGLAGRL